MHPSGKQRGSLPKKIKVPVIALASLLLLGLVLHLTLPFFLLRFANRKLSEIPDYRGHIAAVDISLLRGAYTLKEVDLVKLNGKVRVPFFSARSIDLSVEWRALFHGKLVTEINLYGPRLNFVAGPPDESQTGIDTLWKQKVEDLTPFRINRFRIHNGEIHFLELSRSARGRRPYRPSASRRRRADQLRQNHKRPSRIPRRGRKSNGRGSLSHSSETGSFGRRAHFLPQRRTAKFAALHIERFSAGLRGREGQPGKLERVHGNDGIGRLLQGIRKAYCQGHPNTEKKKGQFPA